MPERDLGMYVNCPLCGRSDMRIFFKWMGVPVHQNFYIPTRDEAVNCTRGDIVLGICENCKFVSNTTFSDSLLQYNAAHDASQHHSPHFQAYLNSIVTDLIGRYKLVDKDIVEIGCGQGEFLRLLCQGGNNRGVGVDPSYVGSELTSNGQVKFVQELYTERLARKYPADCICCRHTLEHIPRPVEIIELLQRSCGASRDTLLYFEVPSIEWIFAENAVSALTYAHCSWFSPESLTTLFESHGFDVTRVRETFGREYLALEAFPKGAGFQTTAVENRFSDMSKEAEAFGARFQATLDKLRQQLEDIRRNGARCVLWGAAGKGTTLLNILDDGQNDIEFVVDINPAKHGSHIPGTGQKIVPMEHMASYRPDVILITNPLYIVEMRSMLDDMDLHPEIVSMV